MHTSYRADFDLNPGRLAQKLKDSLDSKTLSFPPQLAVMDMPTDEATFNDPGDDLQHNIPKPLIMNDYSAYGCGEQINCEALFVDCHLK